MKFEIKRVLDGIMRITTSDERWYHFEKENIYRPSATWIASFYPKGIQYYKWLAEHGWDEAEALKREAGERGSKVHQAIDLLIKGMEVKIDDKFINTTTLQEEELTPDEYHCVMTFKEWVDDVKPVFLQNEYITHLKKFKTDKETDINKGFAGTVDFKCIIGGQKYIVDIKTSAYIWTSHEIQINMYRMADTEKNVKMAILQVGYTKNKTKQYKFTEVEYQPDLVKTAHDIWKREAGLTTPKQKDYPMSLKLQVYKLEKKVVKKTIKKVIKKINKK